MKTTRIKRPRISHASIKDVARDAGVSIAAASYALNGRQGVAEVTRRRVMKAAAKLNYSPSKTAQTMRTGKTDAIGLVLPDLTNPFFPQFAKSVQQSASAIGKSVFLIDTSNDPEVEKEGVIRLVRQGVDGIIWWPSKPENCDSIGELGIPLILVDCKRAGIDSVTSDHELGGKLLAELVNESSLRRIGLIRGPSNFCSAGLRRNGFVDNLKNHSELVWEEQNSYSAPLSDTIKSHITRENIDLVVCPNDLIAIEVIRYLRSIDKKVPYDVSVTGFGDIQFSDIISPPLTTVHQPLAEMGAEAVKLLQRRIDSPDAATEDIVLTVHAVIRSSMLAKIGGVVAA